MERNSEQLIQLFSEIVDVLEEVKKKTDLPIMLTVDEAAKVMQISPTTMRNKVLCRPDFPKIRIGTIWRIPTKALFEWMEEEAKKGGSEVG